MSPIREFDIFIACAGEVVFADIDPTIGDVIQVRENFLIHNDSIGLTRVSDRIDRAFSGSLDRGNAHIDSIHAIIRTRREIPLRGASGRCGARLGVTHHIPLGTARRGGQPTFNWILYKVR